MDNELYLYGASGHGMVIAEIAEQNNITLKGFIDKDVSKINVLGRPVLHTIPEHNINIIISIGSNKIRKQMVDQHTRFSYPTLRHPFSTLSKRATLGEGTVVMAGAVINVDVNIGKHCIINTNASIDHECQIGDFVHISPNVALAGNVVIGEGTHIGIGASVIPGINIGKWCTVGAGAVIIRDIPDGATVVGNPGRIIKQMEL